MLGAFCAYFLLHKLGLNYWWSLAVAPLAVGAFSVLIERTMLKQLLQARPPLRPAAHLRPRR